MYSSIHVTLSNMLSLLWEHCISSVAVGKSSVVHIVSYIDIKTSYQNVVLVHFPGGWGVKGS